MPDSLTGPFPFPRATCIWFKICHPWQHNMSAPEPEIAASEAKRSGLFSAMWVALVIFFLYALSPGPMLKLALSLKGPTRTLELAYAPLGFLCDHVAAIKAFYDWYLGLWGIK